MSALVIGGSRGLGELVAKSLAAGGAVVTLTYAVGKADAVRVQTDIVESGGQCDIAPLNVLGDLGVLTSLAVVPNQIYYMASSPIFRRSRFKFDSRLFEEFMSLYVTAFYQLLTYRKKMDGQKFVAFYPSSVAVVERPENLTEYAMAKAAGEILCADLQSPKKLGVPIIVRRLPRLATDQTAALTASAQVDTMTVLRPILEDMYAATAL